MVEAVPRGPVPGRILGLYALSVMAREGPVHGYGLAERIAERTGGAWRPGAGAIYPALNGLARRHLARMSRQGVRRVYRITPTGRRMLREVRRRVAWRSRGGLDLSLLWAEIAGVGDPGEHLVSRLGVHLDAIYEYLLRRPSGAADAERLRRAVRERLADAERRLGASDAAVRSPFPAERGVAA